MRAAASSGDAAPERTIQMIDDDKISDTRAGVMVAAAIAAYLQGSMDLLQSRLWGYLGWTAGGFVALSIAEAFAREIQG